MQPMCSVVASVAACGISAKCGMRISDVANHVVDGASSGIESLRNPATALKISRPYAGAECIRTGVRQLDRFPLRCKGSHAEHRSESLLAHQTRVRRNLAQDDRCAHCG